MHGTRSRNVIENLTRNMDDDARSVEDRERESRALTPQQSEFWKQWLEKYGCVQFNVRDRSEENGDLSFRTGDKSAGLRSDCSICLGELIGSSGSDGSEAEEVEIENRGVIGSEGNCLFDAVADVDTSVDIEVGGIMDENSLAGEHCQSSSNQAGSNYIVRYPCHGEHYFHASCLHSWLQVATQNPHNMPAGSYGIDYNRPRTFYEDGILERCVSCPCCRERPSPGTQGRLGTSIQGNIDSSVSSRAAAQYDASYTEATVSGNNVGNQI